MTPQTQEMTAEHIMILIRKLPSAERARLDHWLTEPASEPANIKPPRDKRVPSQPMPDDTRERQWVKEHKHEYAGQWVALDGDRLVAASPVQQEVWDAISADTATIPLVLRIPSLDDLPYIGI